MLKINFSKNLNLKIITPPTIFNDHRGMYTETYNEQIYKSLKLKKKIYIRLLYLLFKKCFERYSW